MKIIELKITDLEDTNLAYGNFYIILDGEKCVVFESMISTFEGFPAEYLKSIERVVPDLKDIYLDNLENSSISNWKFYKINQQSFGVEEVAPVNLLLSLKKMAIKFYATKKQFLNYTESGKNNSSEKRLKAVEIVSKLRSKVA